MKRETVLPALSIVKARSPWQARQSRDVCPNTAMGRMKRGREKRTIC
jgi:hypothetical protein